MMTREDYDREYRSLAAARDMAVKVNDKKLAKHYRQQISRLYEDYGKYMSDSSPVVDRAELDRLDAQRYRKLKAYSDECRDWEWSGLWEQTNLDAAVDALPDPDQTA